MPQAHYLRFKGCVKTEKERLADLGAVLKYLIVVSSDFPGRRGAQHPYLDRDRALQKETGVKLDYIRAIDLAQLAALVESNEVPPSVRERFDWKKTFDAGLVDSEDLVRMLNIYEPH